MSRSGASAGGEAQETVLQARHLAGRFMQDVSFDVRRGEIVGVAGLIESGINELPQILGGVLPRRGGTLVVGGHDLPVCLTPRAGIRAGLMLLPVDRLRSGGVGTLQHFVEGAQAGATGLLAASVFHFGTFTIPDVKHALAQAGLPVRQPRVMA